MCQLTGDFLYFFFCDYPQVAVIRTHVFQETRKKQFFKPSHNIFNTFPAGKILASRMIYHSVCIVIFDYSIYAFIESVHQETFCNFSVDSSFPFGASTNVEISPAPLKRRTLTIKILSLFTMLGGKRFPSTSTERIG